ncbi:MAG: glycine cleavage system aminomethyltransferase GcvT [Micavibrio sp.]
MKTTPLHAAHLALKAKMAEFAGYDMPIQYQDGVLAEHHWTRDHCGVFDVSHMGQIWLEGAGAAALWDRLTPSVISEIPVNTAKYSVLTNEQGGIIDDLIITRLSEDKFFAVINAGCKDKDIGWIQQNLTDDAVFTNLEDRALLALQGPKAEQVLKEALGIDAAALAYMHYMEQGPYWISRLGYTGEDGFEVSMPSADAAEAWEKLLNHPEVKPAGLAARDSLRLDMGYPLYGHDLDADITPVEAGLSWIIGKDHTGYSGEKTIRAQRESGPVKKRIGFKLTGKGIAREGAEIYGMDGVKTGDVTSGGFSPTLNEAIGQAYVTAEHAAAGTPILVRVRGRDIEGVIAPMPFVPAKTKIAAKAKTARQ